MMTTTLAPRTLPISPSPTLAQRRLLLTVAILLAVHVAATALFVLGG